MTNAILRGKPDAGNPHLRCNVATVRRIVAACGAVIACAPAVGGETSEPVPIFLRTEASSFWRTAPGSTMTLPIDFPEKATTASLEVRGTTYAQTYANITTDTFELTLPEARRPSGEDVYELTLTFDDGTVRTARFGLIRGRASGGEGSTRCCLNIDSTKWHQAYAHSVLPVPAETTALTVNGTAIEEGAAGFTGAQGWYALPDLALGSTVPATLTTDGEDVEVPLTIRGESGLILLCR